MDDAAHNTHGKAGKVYVFDFEVFPNFFYALFLDLDTGEFHAFAIDQLDDLKRFVSRDDVLIGYNNRAYQRDRGICEIWVGF